MPTIRIDDDVWSALQKQATAFVDSPNDVLRRLLGLRGRNGNTPRRLRLTEVRRGAKTPEEAFRVPVLQAIERLGGRARVQEIIEQVGNIMSARLNEYDRETTGSGAIRWQNTAQWARNTMANKMESPLINPSSPHGWWEITDTGRRHLQQIGG